MAIRIIREVIAEHPLVSTQPGMSVREACRLMVDKHIGALLVLEGKRIVGIFTERNALTRILAAGRDPDSTTVGEVMVADPVCITEDKPLTQALLLMADGGLRHFPDLDATGLPPVKLTMHMWDETPTRRFVILDGQRMAEGDRSGGLSVVEIRRDGVVVERDGQRARVPLP